MPNFSYQPKKYVKKRNLLASKESLQLKVLHNKIFMVRSKWNTVTATKNKDLIPLLQNFHVNYALKISASIIKQFDVISFKYGSTLNVTILIILITNIYKVVTNHGIASLVRQCSFHLNNQKFLGFINNNNDNNNESKNSNSYLILKPPQDLALLFNQFNNVNPENNSNP